MGSKTVAEVMTAPALVAVEEETLEAVAARMAARGVGSVVVVEAGHAAPGLAASRTFEDVWHLMFDGELPTVDERVAFHAEVAPLRPLPAELHPVLAAIAPSTTPMEGLRTALSHLAAIEELPPSLHLD